MEKQIVNRTLRKPDVIVAYTLSFQLFSTLNDAPWCNTHDDNIRTNLRSHEKCITDMFHHAGVAARCEDPCACRFRRFQQATFQYLTKTRLEFEILNATVNTDDLNIGDDEEKSNDEPSFTRLGNCNRHCFVKRLRICAGFVS